MQLQSGASTFENTRPIIKHRETKTKKKHGIVTYRQPLVNTIFNLKCFTFWTISARLIEKEHVEKVVMSKLQNEQVNGANNDENILQEISRTPEII